MMKPEGAVPYININGLKGKLVEYIILADLFLPATSNQDTKLNIQINQNNKYTDYSSMEHIYGIGGGGTFHSVVHKPTGNIPALFMARTHAHKSSAVNVECKIYSSLFYSKIILETIKPNNIIAPPGDWMHQDITSIYNSPISEIETMLIFTEPNIPFHGILKIYKRTEE